MKVIIAFILLISSSFLFGQSLSLDSTFGTNGSVVNTNILKRPIEMFFENNKYIIVLDKNQVCSYNFDGTIDLNFGTNGSLIFNDVNQTAYVKGAKLVNGSIYVYGFAEIGENTNNSCFIVKLSTTGVLDSSFGTNGKLVFDLGVDVESINDIAINSIGTIFATGNKNSTIFLAKITNSGNLDLTFHSTGYKTYIINPSNTNSFGISIYFQGSDLLLVGNTRSTGTSYATFLVLIKVNENGEYISSFGTNGINLVQLGCSACPANYSISKSNMSPNNVLNFQYSEVYSLSYQNHNVGRYNLVTNNLTLDYASLPGRGAHFYIDSNNKTYITGFDICYSSCSQLFKLTKRNSDSTLDTSFNYTGNYQYNFNPSTFLQPGDESSFFYLHDDGKIVLAGYCNSPYFPKGLGMIRLVAGELDTNEFTIEDNMYVFPNPTSGEINILNNNKNDNQTISSKIIYDIMGKLILQEKSNSTTLDVKSVEEGIYFLKITIDNKESVLKFIKK